MQEALADISHQEETGSVLFSINSQRDAGGQGVKLKRSSWEMAVCYFYLERAPVADFRQEFFYFCVSMETLFHRKRKRGDVAVSKVLCSLKMFNHSEVILDTGSDFPLYKRQLVWSF